MTRTLILLAILFWPTLAGAQVTVVDYRTLARELDGRIGFDALPQRAEPGFALDAPMRCGAAWLGERFAGQSVTGTPSDRLTGAPTAPLTLRTGAPGANLSVAFHRGFASNALFPLGPVGFPALSARGEGAVAILFDRDQSAIGLRVHADYDDPLGTAPPTGEIVLRLFARDGRQVGAYRLRPPRGATGIGLRRAGGIPDIAGFTVTNTDPGGIAIDDILYSLHPLLG